MGALIIGQAVTMQNTHGMEYIEDEQDNRAGYELYYPDLENNQTEQ